MRKLGYWNALRGTLAGAFLLQITACFGPDPQLYFTSTVTNAVIANLIDLLFSTLTAGLAAA